MKATRQLLALLVVAMPLFAADTFTVDKNHSTATFKVRHMVSNVVGQFRDFNADVNIDRANPAKSSVEFTIQAASIDTGNANRDTHLKSPDFFDVEKFPAITFKSTADRRKVGDRIRRHRRPDHARRDQARDAARDVRSASAKTARGEKAGFEIETTLNRKDYGVLWNKNLDEGGLLLGDDVKVTINLEMDKKVAAAAPAATK
jgi:polyisoprenoid-binding protein YceI